jgi:mRNA-degrading endonuclease RelE of RelBE toxin-antitoxin system
MATVLVTPAAQKQIHDLQPTIHARVIAVLERLASWPNVSGAKPLKHGLAGSFRVRTGDWRVRFHVSGMNVIVTDISDRRDAYE